MSRSVKSTAFAINMTAVIVGYCMGWWWYSMPQPESADVPTPAASQPTEFVGFIPSDVDLGEQPWYAEVPFEAIFANLSSAPVVLADVLSSCGCVAVDAERLHGLPLAPSGTVVVNGTVKVGATRGFHERYLTAVMDDGRAFELAVLYSTVPASAGWMWKVLSRWSASSPSSQQAPNCWTAASMYRGVPCIRTETSYG
jgi:hypothetical protein